MAENTINSTISDMELFRKLMRFMRQTRRKTGSFPGMGGMRGMGGIHGMPHGRGPGMDDRCRMRPDDPRHADVRPGAPSDSHCRRRPPLSREHLLILIGRHPEGIRQKALAEEVNIGPSSASELINKLEATGYVERKVDPDDKRATLLFLTDIGRARAAEVEDERAEVFKGVFDGLTEDEKKTLSDLLDKLLAADNED